MGAKQKDKRKRGILTLRAESASTFSSVIDWVGLEEENSLCCQTVTGRDEMALTAAEFTSALQELYRQIREWNDPLNMNLGLTITETHHQLTDERNGTYTAPGLRLARNGRTLVVEPVGCVIVGADARVDLRSGGQRESIVYYRDDGWAHADRHEYRSLATLDEDSFHRVAEVLLR